MQLLSDNPLTNTHLANDTSGGYGGTAPADTHLSARLIEDYPTMFRCPELKPKSTCITFNLVDSDLIKANWKPLETWNYAGLKITSKFGMNVNKSYCLNGLGKIHIEFPEGVSLVYIKFCNKINPQVSVIAHKKQERLPKNRIRCK